MESKSYLNDIDSLNKHLAKQQRANLIIGIALVFSVLFNFKMLGNERTIVTPPKIEKSFWVTATTADRSYLEQMSAWVANLTLNVTADDINWKRDKLLEITDGALHGDLRKRIAIKEKELKQDNATTYFTIQSMQTSTEKLSAVITGRLHTLINHKSVGDEEKSYYIRFAMDSGRAKLVEFQENDNGDLATAIAEKANNNDNAGDSTATESK